MRRSPSCAETPAEARHRLGGGARFARLVERGESLLITAAGRRQLPLHGEDLPEIFDREGRLDGVAERLAEGELALEVLARAVEVPLGDEHGTAGVEHLGLIQAFADLHIPVAGLVEEFPRLAQLPPVAVQRAQLLELCRGGRGAADLLGDGERLYIGLLRAVEVPLDLQGRPDVGRGHADPPLIAGLPGQLRGFPEQTDGILGFALRQQRVPLIDEGLGDHQALTGLAPLRDGSLGGALRAGDIGEPPRVPRLRHVDARVLARGRRQLVQRGERRGRLGTPASQHQALAELQPILDVVREKGPERPVGLARLAPLLARPVEAPLDGEALLARQRTAEVERLAGLVDRVRVIAQLGPGPRQGGVDHRRAWIRLHGLLQGPSAPGESKARSRASPSV